MSPETFELVLTDVEELSRVHSRSEATKAVQRLAKKANPSGGPLSKQDFVSLVLNDVIRGTSSLFRFSLLDRIVHIPRS